MRLTNQNMRSTAIAALLSLPVMVGAAFAQQTEEGQSSEAQSSATQSQDTAQQQSTAGDQQEDSVVATVDEAEIRGSDVMTFISMLPPQLQSQPPQMLVPMALEQLIVRELVLEAARAENMAEDPDVIALVEGATQTALDDAMVQVYVGREMEGAVTAEAVQQAYEQVQEQSTEKLPPLEEVRPQIEQFLRQQAMQGIQMRLREGADIVLYDPTGQPMKQQDAMQQGQSSGDSGTGASDDQSDGDSEDPSGSADETTESD